VALEEGRVYDTLIIGAGLIGSSVGMHLGARGVRDACVVDFDLEGTFSSSELNAGGVRATWVQPINILASKISIEYYAKVADRVGYRPCGYLWMHGPGKFEAALKARERQVEMGWPVEVWDNAELMRRVPLIDKTDGIAGSVFAPRDGLLNPNLLKKHYREEARKSGIGFEDRVLIRAVDYPKEKGKPILVYADQYLAPLTQDDKGVILVEESNSLTFRNLSANQNIRKVKFFANRIVNCAGAWAPKVARALEYECPSHPVRRQVCIFDGRDLDLTPYGMMIDPSGVYFHPEATNGLAGFADPSETPGYSYQYEGESFFLDVIWPALYERSTKFERLRHLTGWAGLYETSPDESAIIGKVVQGAAAGHGVYEVHSFSGHGAMHSYAAGLGIAELMVDGKYRTVDFSPLAGDRFSRGELFRESLVI
jgi:sarcosine oxidase subunit beta